jgi:hypothetical protein
MCKYSSDIVVQNYYIWLGNLYLGYVFNYVILDISIIPPRPNRDITIITMEGH